ncbi:MAG: triose-phosphate isomerase [Cyclobacteriaceae bacterium]|nr:triose-phosphate isomerase [Cyclobacteriaceae bacterium]MCH8514722.1 triose-phosphate isomerase [Cyclobacteriaceae bacterium]
MRKKIVAGNWKMNKDLHSGRVLTSEISNMVADEVKPDVQVIICAPYIHLTSLGAIIEGRNNIAIGAQNLHQEVSGAYTGEISASMLQSIGINYAIIGHSERREYFGESDALISKKIDQAFENNITPIYCCGETLDIREADNHFAVVNKQISDALFHLSEDQIKQVIIAYEPVWAIGTGKTATAEQAQEMHKNIREHLSNKYSKAAADAISILYGGSCKPDNAKEIFAGADVDGGLIGGASLKSRDFVDICKSF